MTADDKEFYIKLRAAKLRQAAALQEQRAAILQEVAVIEQTYNIPKHSTGKVQEIGENDSLTTNIK